MYTIHFKSFFLLALGALAIATGCVKDKAFENHEYGITDPANQPKGVLFQSSKIAASGAQQATILSFEGLSTPQTAKTVVKIAADQAVTSDLRIKISVNDALVEPSGLTVLESKYFTAPAEVVIPAGQKFVEYVLTIPDATIIDPSEVYGVGLTIAEVGNGFTIAENSKNVVIGVAIKNPWDGTYESEGYVYHPSSPRAFTEEKHLGTVSANSVSCNFGDLGGSGYVALLTIDPVTNKVAISDYTTGVPMQGFDTGLPTTNPGYTPKWVGSPECNNTYDPVTKTFYLRMAYMGGTGWRVTEEILVRK